LIRRVTLNEEGFENEERFDFRIDCHCLIVAGAGAGFENFVQSSGRCYARLLQLEAKNLTAAAEEMPADNYSFRPTSQQMTFAHLMAHIGVSNRFMCSGIAGQPVPKDTGVTDKDGKDKLVAEVKASFDYCTSALAKVDDSKLREEIPSFGRTRANLMMFLTAGPGE
jgi:hypothetical protein